MKIVTHYLLFVLILSIITFSYSANLFLKKATETSERRRKGDAKTASTSAAAAPAKPDAPAATTGAPAAAPAAAAPAAPVTPAAGNTTSGNSTNTTNNSTNDSHNCGVSASFEDEAPVKIKSKQPYGASTNVFGRNVNASNAAGFVGNKTLSLDKAPWRMKTCDQVMQIEAQRLKDYNDYSLREPAFFTLSIYMINMFSGKDNNRLVESINIENISNVPSIIPGSKSCLDFFDVKNQKRISMCLDDMDRVDDVKELFQKIMRCRMGDNLTEIPIQTIKKIFEASCLGMNLNISSKIAGSTNNFLASLNLRNQLAGALSREGAKVTSTNPWEIKYMTPVPGS